MLSNSLIAIHSLCFIDHTNENFKNDNILKLSDIYKINICSHTDNYNRLPNTDIFSSRFETNSNYHNHNTRNKNNIILIDLVPNLVSYSNPLKNEIQYQW